MMQVYLLADYLRPGMRYQVDQEQALQELILNEVVGPLLQEYWNRALAGEITDRQWELILLTDEEHRSGWVKVRSSQQTETVICKEADIHRIKGLLEKIQSGALVARL